MTAKELINIINDYDVKVVFDKPEEVAQKIMNGISSPIFFTPVEGAEREKYEKSNQKSTFISTTECIHIPDLEITDIIDIFQCSGTAIYDMTVKLVTPYVDEAAPDEIVFMAFLFLHEVGHWKQFIDKSKLVEEFTNIDLLLDKDNFDKTQRVMQERNERISRGNNCPLTAKERKALEQLFQEYRQIPKEKDADNFAFGQINNALKKYKNIIG